jgi:Na+-transporting NADH:ubiquinone oxidoreductase subunit NqrC
MSAWLGIIQVIATVVIAGAGVVIAAEQKRLADIRLRNDLFDRRLKIYDATKKILQQAVSERDLGGDKFINFAIETNEAAFFFSQNIIDYIDEISKTIADMRVQQSIYIENSDQTSLKKTHELQIWCANQLTKRTLLQTFKPEMGLEPPPPRSWIIRTISKLTG